MDEPGGADGIFGKAFAGISGQIGSVSLKLYIAVSAAYPNSPNKIDSPANPVGPPGSLLAHPRWSRRPLQSPYMHALVAMWSNQT